MASNVIAEKLMDTRRSIFFSFSSYIQLLFCQYHVHSHTHGHERRVERYERLTAIFDGFFFFFVIRPLFVYTYRHVQFYSSVRHVGEYIRAAIFLLSFSFLFSLSLGHTLIHYVKFLEIKKRSIMLLRNLDDVFWSVPWTVKEREKKSKNGKFSIYVIHILFY
jgi:hypothetical protein